MRRCISEPTIRFPRPAPRSVATSAFTTPGALTRALTGRRQTMLTSLACRTSREPEPGRRSTYQNRNAVQTNRATAVHAEAFACGAEHGEQHHGESIDQEQAVAPGGFADARGAKPHAETRILGIAEAGLDGPAFGVVIHQHGSRCLGVTRRKAPRLLHRLGVNADHRADLVAPRRRDPGIAQLARPSRLAHPVAGRAGLARGIGDMDIAAKPDNVAEAQVIEEREQLVVAEAAVREDRDGTTGRREFLQSHEAGILEVVALLRKLLFPDGQPQQRRRPAMFGHQIERKRRLSVAVEIGPVHGNDDCLARSDQMGSPVGETQTSMLWLLSSRSTCLIACLVTSPRACASACPITATASDALVITPNVAPANASTLLA